MNTHPEALRLADELDVGDFDVVTNYEAASELRRMHDLLGKANALCRIRAEEIERLKAQPAQEPVACVQDLDEVKRKHFVYEKGMDWKDPLYTAPQRRTWFGLTRDEVSEIWARIEREGDVMHEVQKFALAIENKLKEKNT